jgi:hypothetical protein
MTECKHCSLIQEGTHDTHVPTLLVPAVTLPIIPYFLHDDFGVSVMMCTIKMMNDMRILLFYLVGDGSKGVPAASKWWDLPKGLLLTAACEDGC